MDIWVVVSGVLIFILGQIVLQFVLEPVKEFNKQRGDTSYLLLRHQAAITNAAELDEEEREEIHEMGAALISTMAQIPFYGILSSARIFGLPAKSKVREAAQELNRIAYTTQAGERFRRSADQNVSGLKKIGKLLNIHSSFDF